MITITLRLSESLLSIFRDTGQPKEDTIQFRTKPGIMVGDILQAQGINPLLVPMVTLNTGTGNKRVDPKTSLVKDSILTLYGPLAGG